MKPLVSVIIPLYNYEKYVKKCLDSVVNQTYSNIEIIVVDDGSTDHSFAVCQEYARRDARIKLFHKENGGIGSAIAMALENATGDYVAFLDSDDYMDLVAYEKLVEIAQKTKADIVEPGVIYIDLKGNERYRIVPEYQEISTQNKIMRDYILVDTMTPLSRKFCRKELLDNMKMLNYSVGIDETISIQIISKASTIVKLNECFYFAVGEPGKDSVSRRAIDGKYIKKQIEMHNEIISYLKDIECDYTMHYIIKYLRFLRERYMTCAVLQKNAVDCKLQLEKIYNQYKLYWGKVQGSKEMKEYSFRIRFLLYLFYCFPIFFVLVGKREIEKRQ